eukprot:TRINITY_DN4210_c0_g1_i3.p1 TRINITY_DN4210_c0_g1~~TRINITY_DN4210_c0_g1_i3.p1  ORF type:complete len:225 (+),score=45.86 TRINITY_DN4210_c0_g1_i3:188-862(+)
MIKISTFLLCFTLGVHSLSLDEVSIPTSHPAGQDLTLSCDYSYTLAESDQIVLTWYHNGSPIPIYQWVPALDMGPQVIHQLFQDHLDITYEASEDKFKKHSALRIINPDQRFSGNYKCRVSTFLDEVSDDKDLFIDESSIKTDEKAQLDAYLCNSADCFFVKKDAVDVDTPVDFEPVEKTIAIGTGIETFSEEAATFVYSSSNLPLGNILLVLLASALIMLGCL